ncbi:MAG TPA: histidine phosphatase family protein [Pirellulaceae bacterium]|jgi:phosphohistidine phosphatase
MKTLLLLRHAKSSHKDSNVDDHERPLNKRGKKDAPKMGRLLKNENLPPDLLIASTARRCRKTAERVIAASGYRGQTRFCGELYEAHASALLEFLSGIDDGTSRVLLIGHNPGLEELLESLTGTYTPLSTAALAQVDVEIDTWGAIAKKPRATLAKIWQPGELED